MLELAVARLSNNGIAGRLGYGFRIFEIEYVRMIERMGARHLVELARMEMKLKGFGARYAPQSVQGAINGVNAPLLDAFYRNMME